MSSAGFPVGEAAREPRRDVAFAQVPGRVRPDADGVLNLVLVGNPPAPGTAEARRAARPQVDAVTAGMAISTQQLGRIARVIVNGRDNAVSLGN